MAQYIDFRKFKENPMEDIEIERDKLALENRLMSGVSSKKSDIVNRLYEIDDIGAIDGVAEDDVSAIKEAETLYAMKSYRGCIAICGLIAESFCKSLACKYGLNSDMKQCDRINELYSRKIIKKSIKNLLHRIRLNRNDCIHLNSAFVSAATDIRKNKALESINSLKKVYSSIFSHPSDIQEIILNEIESNEQKSQEDLTVVFKNVMSRVNDYQVSFNEENIVVKTVIVKVLEIDISGDKFKEMTVLDQAVPWIPFVIDLTYAQADEIESKSIREEQYLLITIMSKISSNLMTETWHLINIDEVLA